MNRSNKEKSSVVRITGETRRKVEEVKQALEAKMEVGKVSYQGIIERAIRLYWRQIKQEGLHD